LLIEKDKLALLADDEFKLKSLNDILQQRLVKRGISLKSLTYKKLEQAAGSTVRQEIDLQQGIPIEKAREIVRLIKDSKLKVQASINGDFVRVSGKDRDTLQEVIKLLKSQEFDFDIQFTNYRSQ
jgi:cyclic-di-GMP-binding protein